MTPTKNILSVLLIGLSLLKSCSTQESATISVALKTTLAQDSVERHVNSALLDDFFNFLAAEAHVSTTSRQNSSTATINGTSSSTIQSSNNTTSGGLSATSIAAFSKSSRLNTKFTSAPSTTSTFTATIIPSGTTISSDTTILAGALLGLSRTGKSMSTDIILPPSKTSFIRSIETVESQLESFLREIGEISPNPPSCGGTRFKSKSRKRSLLGDLISSAVCDLISLKGWLTMEPPDIPSIGLALDKIGAAGSTMEGGNGEEDDQDKTLSDGDHPTKSPSTMLHSTNISAKTEISQSTSSCNILSNTNVGSTILGSTTLGSSISSRTISSRTISSSTISSSPISSSTNSSSTISSSTVLSSTTINETLDPSGVTGFPLTISVPTMVADALSDVLFAMLASEFGTEISGLTTSVFNSSRKSIAATIASSAPPSSQSQESIINAPASSTADPEIALLANLAATIRSSLPVSKPPPEATYLETLSESADYTLRTQTLALEVPTSPLSLPQSTTSPPAFPSVKGYNVKGSTLCSSIGAQTCRIAYSFYNPEYLYFDYTAYVATSISSAVNAIFGPFASNGCTAMLKCQPSATALYGKQIIAAFDYLFKQPGFGTCGSIDLANGCELTLNACNDCEASVPCEALPVEDQPDRGGMYPCYFANGTTWLCESVVSSVKRVERAVVGFGQGDVYTCRLSH